MSLEEKRAEIDRVDTEIIEKLAERALLVLDVAAWKREHQMEPLQQARFAQMLADRVAAGEAHGLPAELIERVWIAIHDSSVALQEQTI